MVVGFGASRGRGHHWEVQHLVACDGGSVVFINRFFADRKRGEFSIWHICTFTRNLSDRLFEIVFDLWFDISHHWLRIPWALRWCSIGFVRSLGVLWLAVGHYIQALSFRANISFLTLSWSKLLSRIHQNLFRAKSVRHVFIFDILIRILSLELLLLTILLHLH